MPGMAKQSKSSDAVYGGKYYRAGEYHGGKNVKTTVNGNLNTPRICDGGDMAYKGKRKGHKKSYSKKTPMVY